MSSTALPISKEPREDWTRLTGSNSVDVKQGIIFHYIEPKKKKEHEIKLHASVLGEKKKKKKSQFFPLCTILKLHAEDTSKHQYTQVI